MIKSNILKNELIFEFASGKASLSKSLMASSYLFLNSHEKSIFNKFENYCGEEFKNIKTLEAAKLVPEDCILNIEDLNPSPETHNLSPLTNYIKDLSNIKWKKIFNGFHEYSFNVSNSETAKLIKMDPGAKVPLHSHNGKEYILVLEGSFCDEYGRYSKGNLQINDSKIKHTPIASTNNGCICLTITDEDLVFYGPFAPILNIITLLKSFLSNKK